MKSFLRMALGLVMVLSAGRVLAAGSFEGEVDMTMTTHNGKTLPIQYFVKGHKARSVMNTEDGKFSGGGIYDWETKEMIVVMDKQKMYMVSHLHPEKLQADANKHFKISKTGKTMDILGHTCQEWDYTSDDENGKVWMTPGIGSWWGNEMAGQSDRLPADQRAMLQTVMAQKLFPMKWESDDKSGNAMGSGQVTKIEKKSLDSSLFEVPAGYKKMEMPSFGGADTGKKMTKEDIMKMMQQYQK